MGKAKQTTSTTSDGSAPELTPAMRQYQTFKELHPECVLFFRMGDFYEMFYEDAKLAHRVLGVTLTQRTEGVPMAGVPYHAVETYLRRMIQAGYRVAVCEQVEEASQAKGVVKRDVTRVVTPGTLTDDSLLEEGESNFLAAVMFFDDEHLAAAWVDLSTGEFQMSRFDREDALTELTRISPRELVYVQTGNPEPPPRVAAMLRALGCVGTPRPGWAFRQEEAIEQIQKQYGVATVTGFGLAEDDPCMGPAGALIHYLVETQKSATGGRLGHLRPPTRYDSRDHLVIDASSLLSLEIERTARSQKLEGSLLSVFLDRGSRPRTGMGKRLLRQWLCFPASDRGVIVGRQRAVSVLVDDAVLRRGLRELLDEIPDVERMAGRLGVGRIMPRDLVGIGRACLRSGQLAELLDGFEALEGWTSVIAQTSEKLAELGRRIQDLCSDQPPAHLRDGGLICDPSDDEILEKARHIKTHSHEALAELQRRMVEKSGITGLKIGYNRVFGYYLEAGVLHTSKALPDWTRVQTLKNAERYTTPELKKLESEILSAHQNAIDREVELFEQLCRLAAEHMAEMQRYAEAVAALDVLGCFAQRAAESRYVRPELVDDPVLLLRQARHPVLDHLLGDRFVANDVILGDASRWVDEGQLEDAEIKAPSLALITGPNMAGKSTFIRQAALLVLLAHTGSFVPAEFALVGMTDRIFTRIGASDELHAGQSTFMVEMVETANLCHHATERSLVILDEIGRGTSTLDGLSLAWAIAEHLAVRGCRTLFATHYHEITQLAEQLPQVGNLHVAVREWEGRIVFLHQIRPGATNRSYGIHVARLAGLPETVVGRANELLEHLETSHDAGRMGEQLSSSAKKGAGSRQLSLFTEFMEHPVVEKLQRLEIESLSPIRAFSLLQELVEQANNGRKGD